jgi:multisubunit Na+/H+ antiporter MnhF subunit
MKRIYGTRLHGTGMRWAYILVISLALMGAGILPVAAAPVLTISATPHQAHIGDVIMLNGTVSGITTIAVYLFVTGPDLDTRGVTLDNLNVPAGRGLFTTAPVQMNDGTWTYTWDTSVILGVMSPGKYTVYVVSSPIDRLRYVAGDMATADVEFLANDSPVAETPLDPALPILAVGICVTLGLGIIRMRGERQ